MWKEGAIKVTTSTKESKIAKFWVKVYDEGSEFGIDDGKISKLEIRIDDETVVRYDRGWDIEPDENNEAAQIAYQILVYDYN